MKLYSMTSYSFDPILSPVFDQILAIPSNLPGSPGVNQQSTRCCCCSSLPLPTSVCSVENINHSTVDLSKKQHVEPQTTTSNSDTTGLCREILGTWWLWAPLHRAPRPAEIAPAVSITKRQSPPNVLRHHQLFVHIVAFTISFII